MSIRPVLRALAAISLVAALLVSSAGAGATPLLRLEIKAHRGGWLAYSAPEESLKALTAAAEDGIDWIEFDVVFTSDGVAVLQHGDTIGGGSTGSASCTQAGAHIHTMTWDQVSKVQCTDKASGNTQPIARLDQVMEMLTTNPKASKTKVDLEVKTYSGQALQQKKQWMAWTLAQTAAIHTRLSISTFAWRDLAGVINAWAPKAYFLALEYANLIRLGSNKAYANVRLAKKLGVDGIAFNVNSSEVGLIRFIRAMGMGVHLYDFDTSGPKYAEQVKFAIANGQRVLGADDPHQMKALIATLHGERPNPRKVTTSVKTKTVLSTKKVRAGSSVYRKIFGTSSTVAATKQNQFDAVRVKLKITATRSGGVVEVAARNSRVGVDGSRVKIRKGTHSYVLYVNAGDRGEARVRVTRTVKVSLAVTGYRIARFA